MNEEETLVFDSKNKIVCVTFEGGAYYFTIAEGEVRVRTLKKQKPTKKR